MAEGKDQQWQLVQEKAFTAWMNETLAPKGLKINDLRVDLSDGVKVAQFFEILVQKKIHTKIETRPVNRIQKIQNLHIALKFLDAEMGVKNPGCSAEDLADAETSGNIKMALGLLWTIYRKYRIATISVQDKSSEEGLLLWVKHVTEEYEGVNIENFRTSFKDGMAFLALVHRFNPEKTKVDFKSHHKDSPEHNLSVAFDLAEQELGIPKLLDVKEVYEGRVDERSLVLYTSLFFHAFKAAAVAQDLEKAKLSTEETLAQEKARNAKLKEENHLLESELEQLRLKLEALNHEKTEITLTLHKKEEHTLQLQKKIQEGEELTLNLNKQVEEQSEQSLKLQRTVQETSETALNLQRQVQEKTEKNLELKQIIEEERNDSSLKLEELQKKNLELNELLHEEQTRRQELESKVTDLSSSLSDNQATNLQVITELRKKQAASEEEIESLKNDIENFKAQLDNERKENNEHNRVLQERNGQDVFHRKGLQVLRNNLEAHIRDLHIWQGYLDPKKDQNWLDFDSEVKPGLNAELDAKTDFVEQLNIMSDKLELENDLLLRIFKTKAAETKDAQIDAKTGKPADTKKK